MSIKFYYFKFCLILFLPQFFVAIRPIWQRFLGLQGHSLSLSGSWMVVLYHHTMPYHTLPCRTIPYHAVPYPTMPYPVWWYRQGKVRAACSRVSVTQYCLLCTGHHMVQGTIPDKLPNIFKAVQEGDFIININIIPCILEVSPSYYIEGKHYFIIVNIKKLVVFQCLFILKCIRNASNIYFNFLSKRDYTHMR